MGQETGTNWSNQLHARCSARNVVDISSLTSHSNFVIILRDEQKNQSSTRHCLVPQLGFETWFCFVCFCISHCHVIDSTFGSQGLFISKQSYLKDVITGEAGLGWFSRSSPTCVKNCVQSFLCSFSKLWRPTVHKASQRALVFKTMILKLV